MKFLLILIYPLFFGQNSELDFVRKNYKKSISDKKICKEMIDHLEKNNNDAIELAYFGAFQTIWAKHSVNPIEKLRTFKKGKINIDKAIKQKPNELESRFIRYSIQKESPKFLGYKDNIDEDEKLLQQNLNQVRNPELKEMIINILKSKNDS